MRRQKGCSRSALPTPEEKIPDHAAAPSEPAGGGLTMDMDVEGPGADHAVGHRIDLKAATTACAHGYWPVPTSTPKKTGI